MTVQTTSPDRKIAAPLLIPRQPTPAARDPRLVATGFARGVAEVLTRARPADQLREFATFEVVLVVEAAAARSPLRPGTAVRRPTVRSVRLAAPSRGVVEACAVVDYGHRVRALAYRLETQPIRWLCTQVLIG